MKDTEFFVCGCESFDHQAIFWLNKEWGDELYVYIHLTTYKSFFKRLWFGLRYAFGYKSRFGDWDQFIFTKENQARLLSALERLNKEE